MHVNSKALPTESALLGKRREPQGQSQVIPTVGKHLQKLKLSYPPGYYKHESVQGQTFNVIKKANKHIDPSIEPLVTCETEPLSGLQTYTHALGNVYKPTPLLLSQSSDQPRKGGMALALLTLHSNDKNKDRDPESDIQTTPQITRELCKGTQNLSKFTHRDTSKEQSLLRNTRIPLQTPRSEHFMAKSLTPLHSNMKNHWQQHKNMLNNPFDETNVPRAGNETDNVHKVLPLPPWKDTTELRKGEAHLELILKVPSTSHHFCKKKMSLGRGEAHQDLILKEYHWGLVPRRSQICLNPRKG